MPGWIRLPSPAMGVALIALVAATSGTTYAAVHIGTKQIRDNAITSNKIRNGAVKNVDLARNSVVTAKIVAGAVTGLQVKDASIGNADLGTDSVSSSKIRNGAVGNGELATDSVTTTKLRANAVGKLLEDGPAESGIYADFEGSGGSSRLVGLDENGKKARTFGADVGLVAATRHYEGPPVWLVTGATGAGVRAAAEALDPADLRDHYAVASEAGAVTPLPLRSGP